MKPPSGYLPSPWIVGVPWPGAGIDNANTGAASWPSANRAIYVPFSLPFTKLVSAVTVATSGSTGNYDLGIYDRNNVKLGSSGAIALGASGYKTWTPAAPLLIEAGFVYYAALCHTATQAWCRWDTLLAGVLASGVTQEATAGTLPATATPVIAANAYIPTFALTFEQ